MYAVYNYNGVLIFYTHNVWHYFLYLYIHTQGYGIAKKFVATQGELLAVLI